MSFGLSGKDAYDSSHVLLALGLPIESAGSVIRLSFGYLTTDHDLQFIYDSFGKLMAC